MDIAVEGALVSKNLEQHRTDLTARAVRASHRGTTGFRFRGVAEILPIGTVSVCKRMIQ